MADPDSPAEETLLVPPVSSSEPGLGGSELQAGGQGVQDGPGGEEEEEEGGADGAFTKPRPPLLHLHRGTDNTLIDKLKLQ